MEVPSYLKGTLTRKLYEGPQFGVLYHYVELRFLVGILNDNRLEGPVSLTRSKDSYVKVWKGKVSILILDKDKLRQNYKITPFRDTAAIDGTGDYSTGGGLGAAAGFYDDKSEKTKPFDEMEEVIENDIENIDKYIVKVILPSQYFISVLTKSKPTSFVIVSSPNIFEKLLVKLFVYALEPVKLLELYWLFK